VDFSKFKTSDWLKVGGGLGFLIFGFFNWISYSVSDDTFGSSGSSGNVFDFFFTGTIPWILVIGTAIITVLLVLGTLKSGGLPWPLIMLAATALAVLLLILRVVFNPLEGKDAAEELGVDVGRGIGMWLSTLSAIAALVGAFLGFKESGGDLNDLKDMNKIKGQFSGAGGGSTPPPPPPPPGGFTPPPPPPPSV
jgi:amino acid transporter